MTNEPRKRGYAKGAARRESIVDIATREFARHGYQSATIRDIAAACGISRAGLLHHFDGKASLLREVLDRRDETDAAPLYRYAKEHGAIGYIRGFIALVERNQRSRGMVELYVRLSSEAHQPTHPAHEFFVHRYERLRSKIIAVIDECQAEGIVRTDLPAKDAAIHLVALMDGLQTQWLLDESVDMAAQIRHVLDHWLTDRGRRALADVECGPTVYDIGTEVGVECGLTSEPGAPPAADDVA